MYDDSEEDSSMDDFICDDEIDMGGLDVQKEIRKITKYDRRKFLDESDDDLSNMESSTAAIYKEEKYSDKMGKKEDAEELAREELALKIKKKKKNR